MSSWTKQTGISKGSTNRYSKKGKMFDAEFENKSMAKNEDKKDHDTSNITADCILNNHNQHLNQDDIIHNLDFHLTLHNSENPSLSNAELKKKAFSCKIDAKWRFSDSLKLENYSAQFHIIKVYVITKK